MNFFEDKKYLLTSYEKDVMNFINKNPMNFVNFSINKIASESFVSTGVISRLYQKLGFSSLRDMQFFIHYKVITTNFVNEESEQKTSKKFAQNISNSYTYAINKIISELDNNVFENVIQKIINSANVILYGNSQSNIACNLLNKKLQNIGIYSRFEKDFSTLLQFLEHTKKEDFFIIFSHSGNSKEVAFLINWLEENKMAFVLISANKTLAFKYKLVINYESQNPQVDQLINLTISQHFIVDVLGEYLIKRLKLESNTIILNRWNKKEN